MSYTISEQRINTMLERIGEAKDLIDDQRFLPFYRGVQIRLEKMGKKDEWQKMIEAAKEKTNPKRYFAKLCKMVRDGTYHFTEKIKKITPDRVLFITDKIVKFGFGKYQKYWIKKANEFINVNGMSGFIDLIEYAREKDISQKYFARAILNCKSPKKYYSENILLENNNG